MSDFASLNIPRRNFLSLVIFVMILGLVVGRLARAQEASKANPAFIPKAAPPPPTPPPPPPPPGDFVDDDDTDADDEGDLPPDAAYKPAAAAPAFGEQPLTPPSPGGAGDFRPLPTAADISDGSSKFSAGKLHFHVVDGDYWEPGKKRERGKIMDN